MYIRETIRVIDGLDISAAAREQIYHRNIRRLMRRQVI
jgi:aminocarboxymuconate-semialdehyde decarboxylase